MVDVSAKPVTERIAEAVGHLVIAAETVSLLERRETPKGDPLIVAQVAGVQAAKRTAELIPFCHPLPLDQVNVWIDLDAALPGVRVRSEARVTGKTGVEMEALIATTVALLTMYDMLKAVDRTMRIEGVRLTRKSGGRSGDWTAPDREASE